MRTKKRSRSATADIRPGAKYVTKVNATHLVAGFWLPAHRVQHQIPISANDETYWLEKSENEQGGSSYLFSRLAIPLL